MSSERIGVCLIPGTEKCIAACLRDDLEDIVRGGKPRECHGCSIELVKLVITSAVTWPCKASNVERTVTLRSEPVGMELPVLAILILKR